MPEPDGFDGPLFGPEPLPDLTGRNLEIYEWRRRAETLQQIGDRFGITRERVRQILEPLPRIDIPQQVERDMQTAERRKDEIIAAFRELGTIPAVAARVGLDQRAVGALIRAAEPNIRLYNVRVAGTPLYTDEELLEALREVARANGTDQPTADQYRAFRAEHPGLEDGRAFPSDQVVFIRFGSLVEARRQAGLRAGRPGRGPSWSAEDAARALWDLWVQLGQAPTVAQYDEFCRGNVAVPSSTVVRRHGGGSWRVALGAAHAYGTGAAPDTPANAEPGATDAAAPGSVPDTATCRWGGPGRLAAPARRAVEIRAMRLAHEALVEMRYETVIDTSATEPYDLVAHRAGEGELRVEVKGTTGTGANVELTRAEVQNARDHDNVCLIIVSDIQLDDPGSEAPHATGGRITVHDPWDIDAHGQLEATMYRYRIG